jgi:phage-related minor tail protein
VAEVTIDIVGRDNFSSVLGDFGNIITGIKSTIDLLTGAFTALYDAAAPFIESAADSELAITRLETVLRSTGGAIGLNSEQLQQYALDLQNVTRFSDEDAMAAEAMLLRYENLSGEIFPELLTLTADVAESLGIELPAAARMIGMALDDPVEGIGRLNTQFRIFTDAEMENIRTMAEHGDVAGAQAIIMDRLTEKFGGAAEAIGGTFVGQLEISRNKLDEIRETIGGALLPVLTGLLEKLSEFLAKPEVIEFFDRLSTSISNFLTDLNLEG